MKHTIILLGFSVLFSMISPAMPAKNHLTCVQAEDIDTSMPADAEIAGTDSTVSIEGTASDISTNIDNRYTGAAANPPAGSEKEKEIVIHQPKLMLESNNLAAEKIQAGSEREFVTCFRNKSHADAIYNLSVSLKPADESISLNTASFYFDVISPQDAISISTIAYVSPTAEPKKTAVEFTFSYENKEGMAYNSSETAWLETFQPVQASMEGFHLAEKVFSMETASAQIQVQNTGRAPIYNARVTLSAPGLFPTENIFAGTLDAGTSYAGTMKIYVGNKNMDSIRQSDADTTEGAYGSTAGTLTLTYEDAFGQAYTQTKEFSTYIQEPEIIELTVEKETETNSWWPAVLTVTVLFFSAALAILAWRLRRSRRQLEDLLLEEKIYERS